MTEVVSNDVEVLGRRLVDAEQPITDCVVNLLADKDFGFGVDAVGELLVDDDSECHIVCRKLSEGLGKHMPVKPNLAVRSLLTPLRMFGGLDEEEAPKKKWR